MTVIVTRSDKGSALTWDEVDANFTNLRDTADALVANATHTGDVTGDTALTIANNVVSNAKLADVPTATFKGRATAGTGDPEDLTATQAKTLLAIAAGDVSGLGTAATTDATAYATAAQGAKADTAVQPGALATVATTGAYADLTGKPTLGTAAAAATTDFAAAAHTHVSTDVTDFAAASRAQTEAALVAGTGITITPAGTGATRTLTIDATGGGGATDLSYDAATRTIASSTGADATLPIFTSTLAGLVPASGGGTANFLRADGTFAAPAAGGLTHFTESVNTSSPNATVPVVRLLATNAATNVDVALSPKGTGALTAHVANNLASGGDKRGANAVDWQTSRDSNTRVAAGQFSVIAGGSSNTASGPSSTVGGGSTNTAGPQQGATVAGGQGNIANGQNSVILGGASNTASATNSVVLGGSNNTANREYGIAMGYGATTRNIYGAWAWNAKWTAGSRQHGQYLLVRDTTGNTPTDLTTDSYGENSTNTVCLPNNSSYYLRLRVIARNTTTGVSKSWYSDVLITRGANAASTAIIGTPTIIQDFGDASLSSASIAITANTTIGCLQVTATGIAATNLRWLGHVEALEVTN